MTILLNYFICIIRCCLSLFVILLIGSFLPTSAVMIFVSSKLAFPCTPVYDVLPMSVMPSQNYTHWFVTCCQDPFTSSSGVTQGVGTPILGHGREVLWWWPPIVLFSIWLGPYFIPQHNPIDPFFLQKKISLSLSHLVSEILGPKVGLIFHPNVWVNRF